MDIKELAFTSKGIIRPLADLTEFELNHLASLAKPATMDFKLLLCTITIVTGASCADSPSSPFPSAEQKEDIIKFAVLLDSDSQLSAKEKMAFVELKAMVVAYRDQLPAGESYDYWFLLRFLSAKNFNVGEAYQALEQHMVWRQEEDINNILEKDWSDMENRFPYAKLLMQSEQLKDGVALLWPFGRWDIGSLISKEQSREKLNRFISYQGFKMMEDVSRTARLVAAGAGKVKGTGYSSKFHIIVDMKGGIYTGGYTNDLLDLVETAAQYYKEAIDHFIFINVPNVPTFACTWSSEGKLACPEESSTSSGEIFTSLTRLVNSNEVYD